MSVGYLLVPSQLRIAHWDPKARHAMKQLLQAALADTRIASSPAAGLEASLCPSLVIPDINTSHSCQPTIEIHLDAYPVD